MIRRAAALALIAWSAKAAAQTAPVVRLQDAGPGPGPALLEKELAQPHIVTAPGGQRVVLHRDSAYRRTVIVLGRDVVVEGRVQGDVVVVAGDLFVHPGAAVTGRLISFGGGIYESALATAGEVIAYRDFTYDIVAEPGGYALSYRGALEEPRRAFALPGLFGLHLPSYDRTNGLSVPLGPDLSRRGGSLLVAPRMTYRSQLGRVDPSVQIDDSLDRRTAVRLWAGRGTFTNERWIWSDAVNSAEFFLVAHDSRNWFRANRAELTAARRWEASARAVEAYVGARLEHTSSVRPLIGATSTPWTIRDRYDPEDGLRPNPVIDGRSAPSFLTGMRAQWAGGDVTASLSADGELGSRVNQLTLGGAIRFPTFGAQSLQFETHDVVSTSGTLRERYAYVGGEGTLQTLDALELGGNELVYVDARYNIPIDRIALPVIGSPVVSVREVLAGAGVDRWPTLQQGVGARVAVDLLYAEVLTDPVHHRRTRFSVGLTIAR